MTYYPLDDTDSNKYADGTAARLRAARRAHARRRCEQDEVACSTLSHRP